MLSAEEMGALHSKNLPRASMLTWPELGVDAHLAKSRGGLLANMMMHPNGGLKDDLSKTWGRSGGRCSLGQSWGSMLTWPEVRVGSMLT